MHSSVLPAIVCVVVSFSACGTRPRAVAPVHAPAAPVRHEKVKMAPVPDHPAKVKLASAEPRFLGLGDNESRKIGDTHPESALAGITEISEVQQSTFDEYQRLRAAGRITASKTLNGDLYFATEVNRDVPFANGSSAMITVTERFKVKAPNNR